MNAQERFADLWTNYLEGELDEAGIAELREVLAADENLLKLAADMYQTHRLLGLVVEEVPTRQDSFVRETLSRLPEESDSFVSGVMADVGRIANPSRTKWSRTQWHSVLRSRGIQAAAGLTIVVMLCNSFWPKDWTSVVNDDAKQDDVKQVGEATHDDVRLASLAHAKFFGELSPPVGSVLAPQREYVLMSGMVEVAFPAGASAIVEGPSVFRVMSDESLALDVGRCSVHVPGGAEGFRVETPVTRVIDRGTRFSVSVSETSETEVQVIEGAADIYERSYASSQQNVGRIGNPPHDPESEIRLTNGEAQKFAKVQAFTADAIPFDPNVYRHGLPDRVVSYKATTAVDDGAEELVSVTIQRHGRVMEIPVEDLIPSRVTWFKATSRGAYVCGGAAIPDKRTETSSDRSLVTGVINPGGSHEPLASDPVMTGETATPGLAIRFDEPVKNGPGCDVVFFDLQTFANPPDGDAFHVSPVRFRDGLKSHTIRVYDLTMESPNARELTNFYVHVFADSADSLARLESLECSPQKQVIKFRGLVVGIDLSDLGYAAGETVEGLFFQDALDDKHYVDPVFIAGLPAVE